MVHFFRGHELEIAMHVAKTRGGVNAANHIITTPLQAT
jgi:hypothetical protein